MTHTVSPHGLRDFTPVGRGEDREARVAQRLVCTSYSPVADAGTTFEGSKIFYFQRTISASSRFSRAARLLLLGRKVLIQIPFFLEQILVAYKDGLGAPSHAKISVQGSGEGKIPEHLDASKLEPRSK